MKVEVNQAKGNYGWLDLQRMNLPFTTMNRYGSVYSRQTSRRTTRIDAGSRASEGPPARAFTGCLTELLIAK